MKLGIVIATVLLALVQTGTYANYIEIAKTPANAACNTECWIPKLDGSGRVVRGRDGKTELFAKIKIWFGEGGGDAAKMMRNICRGHLNKTVPTELARRFKFPNANFHILGFGFNGIYNWAMNTGIASCYGTIHNSSGTPTPAVYCLSRCGNLSQDDAVTTYLGGPINSWLNQGCGSPGRSSSAKNIKYCNNGGLGICKNADGVTRCKKLSTTGPVCTTPGKKCSCKYYGPGSGAPWDVYPDKKGGVCSTNFDKENMYCRCPEYYRAVSN